MADERLPAFLEVSQVADLLGFHPSTVRENIVPLGEWSEGDSTIPAIRIGRRYLIPRWWFRRIKEMGREMPKGDR